MRNVYKHICKQYEEVVRAIIMDSDLNNIDFPLVCEQLKVEGLSSFLTQELQNKLDLKDSDDFDNLVR